MPTHTLLFYHFFNTKIRLHSVLTLSALVAGISCFTLDQARGQFLTRWNVSEFQPDIKPGGRANTFAVHPVHDDIIFVTSETGGLFKSTDRGRRWRHVDNIPSISIRSVAFVPSNPDIVIATTLDDFKMAGGGGIWRSTDGGTNWAQVSLTLPSGGRLSAYEISVAPDTGAIYVGIEFGVLMSSDAGVTWTFQDVFGPASDKRIFSIVALGGEYLIAGGPTGIRRSVDGGATWTMPKTYIGGISDLHALGRSPLSQQHAFAGIGGVSLFRSEDAGETWTQIPSAPAGGGPCGGISFTRTKRHVAQVGTSARVSLHIYYSNRCNVARLVAPVSLASRTADYSGPWQAITSDHDDTRDLAFDNSGRPLLLATDGGLHKTADGGNSWTYTGGGRDGYNALQITEINAQLIEDIGRQDLYFGTQDNRLWSSGDAGATWTGQPCCEGFFIEAERRVPTSSESKVTFVACGPCSNQQSVSLFSSLTGWANPNGATDTNPMILRRSVHLQGVYDKGGFSKGLAVTTDLGQTWSQFAAFPEDRRDQPKVALPGSDTTTAIIYQSYKASGVAPAGFEIDHLARIHKDPTVSGNATVYYPAMNNFGGLGINPTMFAWYQVFAVDPGNPYHVIAPDVLNQRVMETRDGGENWTEITQLTTLATDNGRLRFNSTMFPIITAISFSPQNPHFVLAGTSEGGIFVSSNNGASWKRIANSDQITYVTDFAWLNANDVVVSTYGRGLWRLQNRVLIVQPKWEDWCRKPCLIRVPFRDLGDPAPFEREILIYEGRFIDAREEAGILHEIVVTPGSSIVFLGGDRESVPEIKISYSDYRSDFGGGLDTFRSLDEKSNVKGLVLDGRNTLVGAVFGEQNMTLTQSRPFEERRGSTRSVIAGRPYIQLLTKTSRGAPAVVAGEEFEIAGRNFPRESILEIRIDGKEVPEKYRVNQEGVVRARVRAPLENGLHSLVVRTSDRENQVLDGVSFLVTHEDEIERDRDRPR